MRTTLNLDDELLDKAAELTGISEKSALVREGLVALVARESGRRLAALGGSDPGATVRVRRRAW
jgi:Arc/MetJ family transcription regulator